MHDRAIRILLVDDHPIVRDGLRGMCESADGLSVVGEAADGPTAVTLAERLAPDVVLLDLRMPGGGGLEAIRAMGARGLAARILVLTTYDTDREIIAAVDAGATGYLLKDAPRADLVAAIRAAAAGDTVLSPAVASRLVARSRSLGTDELSPREVEVITLVAQGHANREIAASLFVSEATVKSHLGRIYDKLAVPDRASAVAEAYRRGILGTSADPTSAP